MAGTLVYVTDPSRAPKGAALQKGVRGGVYYISKGKVGGGKVAAPKAAPKPKKGPAAKKPPPPPKRAPGGKFQDENDPNLPGPVKLESEDVRKQWVAAFNKTLDDGGSDADAMFEAKKVLPKRTADGKPEKAKPVKREVGQAFAGGDDANLPANVRAEAPTVRDAYARVFNDTLAKGGSEADASFAAKQTLPKRTVEPAKPEKPKPVRRQVGQPFSGVDDPNLTMRVRTESTQVREDWVKTFNDTLKRNGSEADALNAANKKLPDRRPKSTTVVQSGRKIKEYSYVTKEQLRDDHGRFAGSTGGGHGGGGSGGGAAGAGASGSTDPQLTDVEVKKVHDAVDKLKKHDVGEGSKTDVLNGEFWPGGQQKSITMFQGPHNPNRLTEAIVPLKSLNYGQSSTVADGIKAYATKAPTARGELLSTGGKVAEYLPHVGRFPDGSLHVESGHTRLSAQILAGRTHAKVQLYDVDANGRSMTKAQARADGRDLPTGMAVLTVKEKAMETFVALDDDRFELIEIGGTAEKDDSLTVRGMVALYPGPEMAKLLAIDPGEFNSVGGVVFTPPEEMHVTIAYYPAIRLDQVGSLIQHVAICAGNCWREIETEIEGIAQFAAPDGEPVPHVILVDPTELMSLRDMLCHSPLVSKDHGFIPHMTLAYVPNGQSLDIVIPPELPLTFDRISLLVGDQRYDFKLGMDLYDVGADESVPSYKDDDSLSVDSVSDDTEDPSQPHVVVSQTTGEGMDDQHSEEEALKAVWSTAFVNDLPDSAFLYIESGGKKDAGGKTEPRSLRHFPYKGDDGKVDLPHLRNAIARIPQSNAPGLNKDALQKQAQSLLAGTNQKAGKRVAGGMREKIATALSTIKDVLNWANYEDEDDGVVDDSMKEIQLDSRQQFVVFKDVSGMDRWLSRSSNAFMDREREIVSTKALEDVVAAADVSGDRGTLRIWHIPGSDIGECDFQGVQGRMLIESGTFYDTPMAQAAKEFFQDSAEPLGMSVGFRYPLDAFDGQTYTKLSSIFERSVLPSARAANPWTDFTTIKEDRMDPKKAAFLSQAVGAELAQTLIDQADEHTKSLEGTVAFKEAKELTLSELLTATKSLVDAQDSDEVKTTFAAFEAAVAPPDEDATKKEDGGNVDLLEAMKGLLQPIAEAVARNATVNAELQASVKELRDAKVKEDEASKESNAPRGTGVFRASSAESNVIKDADAVKEALGNKEASASPVSPYIGDLIGSGRGNS